MANASEKLLQQAVNRGNLESVQQLLQDFDLSDQPKDEQHRRNKKPKVMRLSDQYKYDLLSAAINKNHTKIVELLLTSGFKVTYENLKSTSISLLHSAVIKTCNAEIVEQIIKHGGEVNSMNEHQNTVLYEAVKKENLDVVKILMKNGVDVNASSKKGSALHEAIRRQNVKLVKYLIKNGADTSHKSYCWKYTPLQDAIKAKNTKIFHAILDNLDNKDEILNFNDTGMGLFPFAVKWGNVDMVKYFLDRGAKTKINATDYEGMTALLHAIRSNQEDIAEYLLKQGASVDVSYDSMPALHMAANLGQAKTVENLLKFGAVVYSRSKHPDMKTALHYACEKGHVSTARVLLDHWASALTSDYHRRNSVVIAAEYGRLNIVKLLLDRGHLDMSQQYMKTALTSAASWGYHTIVTLLINRGVTIDKANVQLHNYVEFGYHKVLKIFLDSGANVESLNYRGMTPLQWAVQYGNGSLPEVIKLLLERNANVNAASANASGRTALHYAAERGKEEIVAMLLEANANVNARDFYDRTPIFYSHKNLNVAVLLVDHGADINAVDKSYKTVFQYAMVNLHSEFVKDLLKYTIKLARKNAIVMREHVLDYIKRNSVVLNPFFEQCQLEITKMKNTKIKGTDVTFYHIFEAQSTDKLEAYARNEMIVEYFRSQKHEKIFPKYANMIAEQFERGLLRQKLLSQAKVFFFSVLNKYNKNLAKLPLTCCDQILNYLDNEELTILRKVVKGKRN